MLIKTVVMAAVLCLGIALLAALLLRDIKKPKGGMKVNKWLLGFLCALGCLFVLSAALVVLISIMYAVSYSPSYLWKMPMAVPLTLAGVWLLKRLDKMEGES